MDSRAPAEARTALQSDFGFANGCPAVIQPDLVILLSSYNGGKFIAEQIDSIRGQTFTGWKLLVRDDGSSDDTVEVLESLAALDDRITLLRDSRGNLGPAASFGVLLEQVRDTGVAYVALADQDDIWRAPKLSRQLDLLRQHERKLGESVPLLIHSDLTVVGEDLSLVHPSFLAFQGLRHETEAPLGALLVQNFVTGCTAVINRALLQAAVPLPNVIMHDWWLALCAAALGQVLYLPEATVLYRQHERNAQGSQGRRAALVSALRRPVSWWLKSGVLLERAVGQARELAQRVERQTGETGHSYPSLAVLRDFCSAFARGTAITRLRVVYRHRIRPRTLLPYPLPFYARVLLWGRRLPEASTAGVRRGSGVSPSPTGLNPISRRMERR
jgi:rhamnosyltransferase